MDRLPDRMEQNARVEVRANGTTVGTRRIVDVVPGSNMTVTTADDAVNDKATLTITTAVDGTTIENSGGAIRVKDGSITSAKIADATIAQVDIASGLALTNIATAAPTPVAGQLWFDSDDNLLHVGNSTPVWVCITPQSATVATSQTTSSASYTDLSTSGPAVTVTTGTKALVTICSYIDNSSDGSGGRMGFAVSGPTTVAAADTSAIYGTANGVSNGADLAKTILVTGLTAGANVFTAKYKTVGGTAGFQRRTITVVGIP